MRAHFAHQIRTARAAHPERSYPEILASALDYRRWRVFSFTLISGDGNEDRLTVARHSALSGGEQSVSLHLPLFAAAHVMLDSADPARTATAGTGRGVRRRRRQRPQRTARPERAVRPRPVHDRVTTCGSRTPACRGVRTTTWRTRRPSRAVSATLLVWSDGELLAEHDGTDLAQALGSPLRRRVPTPAEGALEFA